MTNHTNWPPKLQEEFRQWCKKRGYSFNSTYAQANWEGATWALEAVNTHYQNKAKADLAGELAEALSKVQRSLDDMKTQMDAEDYINGKVGWSWVNAHRRNMDHQTKTALAKYEAINE